MFKAKIVLFPEIVKYIFVEINRNHYNLQNQCDFRPPLIRTVYHGSESISYLGPNISVIFPEKLK